MIPLFSRRGIEKDGLGEIKDFHVGHQYLDDNYPDLSLSAILLCEDDFDCRIISMTYFLSLRNLAQKRGGFVCLGLR